MRVDKAVQERLVDNLNGWLGWLDRLYDSMRHYIIKIREAETVEEMMHHKKEMLVEYVNSIPIGPDECYFCLLYLGDDCEEDCEEVPCEYGVVHGFCGDDGSDYREIRKLVNELRQRIEEKYYKGESYPDTH